MRFRNTGFPRTERQGIRRSNDDVVDTLSAESTRDRAPGVEYFPSGIIVGDGEAPPEQVAGVTATAGLRTVLVEWDRLEGFYSVDGAGGYEVELDTVDTFDSGSERLQRTGATLASFTDLATDTTYYVRVRSVQGEDNVGEWSSTASVATPLLPTAELDGEITETQIADDAITTPKIAANAVTAAEIAANAIVAGKIQAGAVSTDKLAANAVTAAKLAAITLEVGKYVQSDNYDGTDVETGDATQGFRIEAEGDAEFQDARIRGDITTNRFKATAGPNLFSDPGFESGTDGWSSGSQSNISVHSGSWSLLFSDSGGDAVTRSEAFTVEPGDAIAASGWMYASTSTNTPTAWELAVEVYDDTDSLVDYVKFLPIGDIPNYDEWQLHGTGEAVRMPDDASYIHLVAKATEVGGSAVAAGLDDVFLARAPVLSGGFRTSDEDNAVEIYGPDLIEFVKEGTRANEYIASPKIEAKFKDYNDVDERSGILFNSGGHEFSSQAKFELVGESDSLDIPSVAEVTAESLLHNGNELPRLIEHRQLGSDSSDETFDIPEGINRVVVEFNVFDNGSDGSIEGINLRFNSLATNYRRAQHYNGANFGSNSADTRIIVGAIDGGNDSRVVGTINIVSLDLHPGATGTSHMYSAGTDRVYTFGGQHLLSSGRVESIRIFLSGAGATFMAGSSFRIYGSA